jgi:NAD(P)-dependent dehydrogenase (short-subunit alcohol dehydrogenase family)
VHYDAQTFAGKVVLVTGASRGIGAEVARQYAHAGAKLALVARSQANLEARRDAILLERPSAQVLVFSADARDVVRAQEIVSATVTHFGRLDVLVANAAIIRPMDQRAFSPPCSIDASHPITESCHPQHLHPRTRRDGGTCLRSIFVALTTSPSGWLLQMLVVLPHAHLAPRSFSVPELIKTKGQIVMLTSAAAQLRAPNLSEYCLSKHAINRFAEFITVGEPYFGIPTSHQILNVSLSSFCRVSRHQSLLRSPWNRQDRRVRRI